MTKKDLIMKLAIIHDMPQREMRGIVEDVFNIMANELVKGECVQILGFGTFAVRARSARKGTHPRTFETMNLPPSKRVCFKQGKALKEAVNDY